jgi:hypothetical protein
MNQSIDYVGGSLSGFRGRTGSMNYVEELNAESQGFLIKCIKVIGEKRESRR